MKTCFGRPPLVLLLALAPAAAAAQIQPAPPSPRPRVETLTAPDGTSATGRLAGDRAGGFRFVDDAGRAIVPIAAGSLIGFDGPPGDPTSGTAPIRVLLGMGQQISGRLGSVDASAVRVESGPGGAPVTLPRGGVLGLNQRPGEVVVFREGFEALDPPRWAEVGLPVVVAEPRLVGEKSLRLPAGGSAVTRRLVAPIHSGRFEVAYHDDGRVVPGQQWFVDLQFRGAAGPETVRVLLDWGEESLAVLSQGGPALPVQRLARRPGWHRLAIRFGPEITDLAVDADELAHGVGPGGPLTEIRLANQASGPEPPPEGAAVHFDDLRLVRLAEPIGPLESDPTQDAIRLADDGDQLFGKFQSAEADTIRFVIEDRPVALPWSEVAGIDFRRAAAPGRPVEGLLVRATWRPNPGADPRDLDQVEGAVVAVSEAAVTLATPYAGDLALPRGQIRQLQVLGSGRRVVLDPTPHHLGNEASRKPPLLDPPMPEGGVLEIPFELAEVPPGRAAWVVVDAVQVVGEAPSLPFSNLVRDGEIRTSVVLNGRRFDYLNRHITSRNEAPERIRLPIPDGLLKAGANRLRFEQAGKKTDPDEFDDLGLLTVAVEFADRPGHPAEKP